MLVLALDTATSGCSVALVEDGKTLAEKSAQMPRGQSEALMPMVKDVLDTAGRKAADAHLFAVTAGPGAFTGLRIGLAAARGMALAAGRPCIGITTFDALARGVPERMAAGRMILTIVESKRADAFVQLYAPGSVSHGDPVTLRPDELADWLADKEIGRAGLVVTGDAAGKFIDALTSWEDKHAIPVVFTGGTGLPNPVDIAILAADIFNREGDAAARSHPARPVYLRAPDVSTPKKKTQKAAG